MEGVDGRDLPSDPANTGEIISIPNEAPPSSSPISEVDSSPDRLETVSEDREAQYHLPVSTVEHSPITSDSHSDQLEQVQSSHPASIQTTLNSFRQPPVLPNLALKALKHLKEKASLSEQEDDEFQPTKKRRVEENGTEDEVCVCVCVQDVCMCTTIMFSVAGLSTLATEYV